MCAVGPVVVLKFCLGPVDRFERVLGAVAAAAAVVVGALDVDIGQLPAGAAVSQVVVAVVSPAEAAVVIPSCSSRALGSPSHPSWRPPQKKDPEQNGQE
jgi:hypothetical protein